jgi:6-phospho-3-hexuloisomerase
MYYREILQKIMDITDQINPDEFRKFIKIIINSPRIYVVGAGRSGMVARTFAMRLVHLGIKVFAVGETVTPALREEDTLLAISSSGKTALVVEIAKATKALKGKVVAITSDLDAPLAKLADSMVLIPSKIRPREYPYYEVGELIGAPFMPLGTLFETSVMIFFEACVIELMNKLGVKEEEMEKIHANI